LGTKFEKETVTGDGVDDAARARRGFDQLHFDAGFLQGVSAYQAGDATADHQCWNMTGHGDVSILAGSESFRKKRLGDELLFFEIRIENHSQIADENAAKPGGADFAAFQEHEAILAWSI
jgi:hypothetical protein